MDHYQPIFAKLRNVQGDGPWKACCPAHDDRLASLSLRLGDDDRLLVNCHAGCTFAAIAQALGVRASDFFPPKEHRPETGAAKRIAVTYDYRDERGTVLYQVVRYEPKDFRQRRPDGKGGWSWKLGDVRKVLYRLPELLAADTKRAVFVVEGEKDVETAMGQGLVATCNVGGAGKWLPCYGESLRGRNIIIIPDNDDPGKHRGRSPGIEHAQDVAISLSGTAASVRIMMLPMGVKDLTDWFDGGGDQAKLRPLVADYRQGGRSWGGPWFRVEAVK